MQILESIKTIKNNNIELIGQNSNKGKILIIGAIHGDEPQGEFLIENFLEGFPDFNEKFLFIPCLNPDGYDLETRTNANSVDINRNFPTKNWEKTSTLDTSGNKNRYWGGEKPASEIETEFVINTVEKYSPSLIITLHTPFKVVNYDGDAKEISQKIADIFGYKVEESIGYPTPGSFGTWAGIEKNIPIITLEMDEEIPVADLIEPFENMLELLGND